jgi:RNA-directed DNA polymerase
MDKTEAQKASAVPARATRGAEARDWSWVEASVWTERMVSALENGVKGGRWYSLMDKVCALDTLEAAWSKVQANDGAAGVDGQSLERFAAQEELYLTELATALRDGSYRPQPVKRVEIPKGDGKTRPLGIPTVKDRIVQTAVKFVLEPIFEATFCPTSYGFRPRLGCRDALREVAQLIGEGHTFVVDADLQSYFDTIPHERLMQRVEERISDGRILGLLRSWLVQDILRNMERWTPTEGTPQGAVISPLLANIYLHPLDQRMAARGYRMVRYADDFVVLCKSREEAEAALAEISAFVADNGLRLHPDKTHIGDGRNAGEGFDFLGYRFEAGRRLVRKKSLTRLKDNIRQKTKRTRGDSLACIIVDLNRTLRGWFGYFKHAHPGTFIALDKFIRRRLRSRLRKQDKRPGLGRCRADHQRWPNAFFAQAGLLALDTAWRNAKHSR